MSKDNPLHFSDREIERYLVGELNETETKAFDAIVEKTPVLREHIAERRASQRAFDQLHPTPAFLTETKVKAPWFSFAKKFAFVPGGLAACVIAFMVLTPEDTIRARGDADTQAQVIVKRGERLFELKKPAPLLRKDDALRVEVSVAEPSHLLIALLQEKSGEVLLSANIEAGAWTQPSSLILDDAAGRETLVVAVFPSANDAERAKAEVLKGIVPQGAHAFIWEKEPLP